MAKPKIYDSIENKERSFSSYEIIKTVDDFNLRWQKYKDNSDSIYRGLSNWQYKLYNSAQRFWIKNEIVNHNIGYHSMIIRILSNAKNANDSVIQNYFKTFGLQQNDLATLSLLQHN